MTPTMQPKRICLVVSLLNPLGGVERVRLTLAQAFLGLGFEVDIVTVNEPKLAQAPLPKGTQGFDLGVERLRDLPGPFGAYLKQRRPDLVIAPIWPVNVLCAYTVWRSRVPARVCVSEHSILSEHYRDWGWMNWLALRLTLGLGYRLAHARVAVSHGTAADVARLGWLRRDAIEVIHNPIPAPHGTDPSPEAAALWPKDRQVARLISVGNLKRPKDQALMIDALARLRQSRPAHLIILGEGAERPALEAKITELGLTGHVDLPGHRSDPNAWMCCADLFVLSSRHEAFGNVLVEAMACGLPVVSTHCPTGPGEILDGGRYGRLTPPGDAQALADGMAAMLDDPTPADILLARAADFAPDRAVQRYLDLTGFSP